MAFPVIAHTYLHHDLPFSFYWGMCVNENDKFGDDIYVFAHDSMRLQKIDHFSKRTSAHYYIRLNELNIAYDDIKGEWNENNDKIKLDDLAKELQNE